MPRRWPFCMLVLAACAAPPVGPLPESRPGPLPAPVEIQAEGAADLVLDVRLMPANGHLSRCVVAADELQWRRLRREVGGALAESDTLSLWRPGLRVFAFAVPAGRTVIGLVVGSEEGVDVVTVDLGPAPDRAARSCVLRTAVHPVQLALVLRDRAAGAEHTLAFVSGT